MLTATPHTAQHCCILHTQARRRGLGLRTYAVLPLTEDCGLLQWVNGLAAFKAATEDAYVAARLYRRHHTPMQIKKMYDNFAGSRRAELLDSVLRSLPPRLSRWLLSRFPDPGSWLAARLAFTRSAAAWAMVGHMLGLGDRHGDNIMIHTATGKLEYMPPPIHTHTQPAPSLALLWGLWGGAHMI